MVNEEKDLNTDDIKEKLTDKEKQVIAWMNHVSDEVNSLLRFFLPISKSGTVGVKYNKVVKAMYESGPEYDPNLADSVEIRLVFDFEKPLKLTRD